jgi:hypothetical protein
MAAKPCTFKRVGDEYHALPTPEGSVFSIQRREHGRTRGTRGWEVGTRIDGDYVPFLHPGGATPLTFDTLREAKDNVRRMSTFGASASAAATYAGMVERGEGANARRLLRSWIAGRSDVLAQFLTDEEDTPPDASWHRTMERQYRAKGDHDAADMHARDAAGLDSMRP